MKKMGLVLLFLAAFLMCIPASGSAMSAEEFASMYDQLQKIDIGGALRVQYNYNDWSETSKDKYGDFGFDTFRFNLDGEIGEMILSAEYRFYPQSDWNAIHHGWVGYNFNENWQGQVGVHQVPFGIQPYASHNFWFSGAYYLGLEDDYDMGLKALYNNGPLDLAFAFYKNGELGNAGEFGRYSIDVLDEGGGNEETNQGNIRCAYTFTHDDNNSTEFGLSGEYGQLYNNTTNDEGDHMAGAAHIVGNYGRWNLQLEGIYYEYDPENPEGANDEVITVGGYEFPYGMPAEATVGIANIAYTLPVDIGPISSLTFYSDNTAIEPDQDELDTSWLNVVGCLVAAGPVYTYFDIISGEEMIFMGDSLVNADDPKDRNTRFNINVGYYF